MCSNSTKNERKGKERRRKDGKKKEKKKKRSGEEQERIKGFAYNTHIASEINKQICPSLSLSLLLSIPPSLLPTPPSCLVRTLFAVFVYSVQFNPLLHPLLQSIHSYVSSHGKKRKENGEKKRREDMQSTTLEPVCPGTHVHSFTTSLSHLEQRKRETENNIIQKGVYVTL